MKKKLFRFSLFKKPKIGAKKRNLILQQDIFRERRLTERKNPLIRVYFALGVNSKHQEHRGVGRYYTYLTNTLKEFNLAKLVNSPEKAEIIHYTFFDLFFPTLKVNFGLSWRQKPLIVVTIHDVIPLVFPKYYLPGKRGKLAFLRQKMALKRVDLIITDSQTSKSDIKEFLLVPEEKIKIVSLAANPNLRPMSKKDQKTAQEKYGLNRPYVLYVGDINMNKNIPNLIKAVKYLPEFLDLVCVGKNFKEQNIPEWQAIQEQIVLNQVDNRIKFLTNVLGEKEDEELAALYSGAIVYIQPSWYEGFGLPILEAMTCGAPVVCTPNSSLLEIGGGEVVFSTGTEAEELAEAITEVLGWSDEHRQRKILAGKKYAREFNWRKTAVETCYWYNLLLNGQLTMKKK